MKSVSQESKPQELYDFSNEVLDLEAFKNNLHEVSSEQLCEIIVSFRYLGILQEESIVAMEELASRRVSGENFSYETRIDEIMETLPKLNMDIAKILRTIKI